MLMILIAIFYSFKLILNLTFFWFLLQIKEKFMGGTLRERGYHCNAYELKHDFGPVLMQQMVTLFFLLFFLAII
jgi:hypothetical protein